MIRGFEPALMSLALCLLVHPSTHAQTTTATLVGESGLHRVVFNVPEGKIYVNFPDDMAVGEHIIGTVYLEPSGKGQKEVDKSTKAIGAYTLEMEGLPQIKGSRVVWTVPAQARSGHSTIRLHDRKGKTVAECDLPVSPIVAGAAPQNSTAQIDLPLGGRVGDWVSAWGSFTADADPSVAVGGVPVQVWARSPRKIVFVSPNEVLGPSTIEVKAGAIAASGPYHALGLKVVRSEKDLTTGQPATMTATVSGLQSLREPAVLVIVNRSPSMIELQGGAQQRITITPTDVRPDGTYQVTRTFTGEVTGDYEIVVTVTKLPSSQIQLRRMTERFVDRWSQVSRVGVTNEVRALIAAGVVEARPQLDDLFLSQLGFRTSPASALDALVSDYCYDLRDRKLAALKPQGRLKPLPPLRLTNAFAPQPDSTAGSLEASDVKGWSIVEFLGEWLSRHTPVAGYGTLFVTSDPDKQRIRIKEAPALNYFTARSLDLGVRSYSVTVGACTQTVVVRPNLPTTMNCPPR